MTDANTDTDKNTRLQQALDRKTVELIDDTAGSIRDSIERGELPEGCGSGEDLDGDASLGATLLRRQAHAALDVDRRSALPGVEPDMVANPPAALDNLHQFLVGLDPLGAGRCDRESEARLG